MALVEIARFDNRVQADLARLLIEAEGMDALLFDAELNQALGSFMPVRLMVLDDDARHALKLLADEDML